METPTTDAPAADAPVDAPESETPNPNPGAPAPSSAFDPEKLPAEIKSYVEKQRAEISGKYADYESKSKAAEEWERVRNDPRFNEWVKTINAPKAPKSFEISDDQFAAALSDKTQFARLVQDAAKHLVESQYAPKMENTERHIEYQQKVAELNQTVAQYPDFKELDKKGLIEPIIKKYPNITFEDAYRMAKFGTFSEEVDKKARGVVDLKKKSTVERPGNPPGARTNRVKAKGREEAMTMVMEAVRAGRPVPEFEEIGDE